MNAVWLEIIGILLLIALVGFFSASEVAILSTRKSKMKELADNGNRRAAVIRGFQEKPEEFLATVHVGIIFSLILASGLAGMIGFQHLSPALLESSIPWVRRGNDYISLGVIVLCISFLVVVFGELVPKSLSLQYSAVVALGVAPSMRFFAVLFRIPARILVFASNLVLGVFKDHTTFSESRISEEEFKLMLEEGTKSGVIDKTEHELIESIFEFTDTTAKEVMIPRPDVVALDVDTKPEMIVKIVLEEGYSRLPVYKGTIDNILGIVYTKDLLGMIEYRNLILLHDVIRPAYFVPETKRISQLMRELQQQRSHMAVVIDEFGGTEGIITMEDIIEEIVGEIHDEYDEVLKDIEQAADGSFLVNARTSVRDFNERFHANIPEAEEYETVSGFLNKVAGRIPDLNEELTFDVLSFAIVKKSQRRIRLVRFRKADKGPSATTAGSPSAS
jgi:putative hemolysin